MRIQRTAHRLAAIGAFTATVVSSALTGPALAQADTTPAPTSASSTMQADRTVGLTTDGNRGVPGQCTDGAYQKFHEATGLWPLINGNAAEWNESAAANGWTVVLDAEARSIVVFEPGVQGADPTYGHVAWVDSVTINPDGTRTINVTEMNFAVPGGFSTRTGQDVIGMSYILAP